MAPFGQAIASLLGPTTNKSLAQHNVSSAWQRDLVLYFFAFARNFSFHLDKVNILFGVEFANTYLSYWGENCMAGMILQEI